MQEIVRSLSALKGVRHAAIYKQGVLTHEDLTAAQEASLISSSLIISQIFSAAKAIGKSHNEVFIGVNSGYLAGFQLSDNCVALLVTEKKINFPMMSVGVKSAAEMLRQLVKEEQSEPDNNDALRPVFDRYAYLLTDFLGPVAPIIVDDAVDAWKKTYVQSPQNLPHLLALIAAEMDSPKEQASFLAQAEKITLSNL